MQIQRIPANQINPAPYNPRQDLKPNDPAYEKLKRSLDEFGCVEPLVWNRRTGNLVGGHQRFKVLLERGATEVDVSVVDLPPERERVLNIALNKIQGDWDPQKLAELLDELTKTPELDVELTGFDVPEVQELIAEVLHASLEGKDEDFDVDAALDEQGPPITQPGELIELGRHRLLCGDSSKPDHIHTLMGGQKAHLLFTDPPYNVDYYGGNRPTPGKARPKPSRQWQRIYADNLSQGEYLQWLGTIFGNTRAALAERAPIYIWNGHRQFGPMHAMLEKLGFRISCVITWAKESFAIGYGDYNHQTEFCLYGWLDGRGGHPWYGPANESTLWEVRRDPTKSYQHPTQKPLELAERAIRNSSRAGQGVLDTFLGSGTTLIGAERTGRRCFGIEIDPRYCDVIVRRYLAFVGEQNVPDRLAKRYRLDKEDVA